MRSRINPTPDPLTSYSPTKTSLRPPSSAAITLPRESAATATASSIETAAIGFPSTSANALTTANPMRNPVNDPGPDTTANPPISALLKLCFSRNPAICGTSSAENVPPVSATTSITSQASPGPHCATAMLPCLPDVSTASRIMTSDCSSNAGSVAIREI